MKKKFQRKGAPPKVPGGFSKVLYIRANEDLLSALDAIAARERQEHPGRVISRADIAREMLYKAAKSASG